MQHIDIYTDGGCHGNPGPGAWAFVLRKSEWIERTGGEKLTTNNRMELLAVIEALRLVARDLSGEPQVRIYTDSQYVRNGITSWIQNWMKNGWKTAAKKPVKNQDLWIRLHELNKLVSPAWNWVRGHSGNPLNERCDELVQQEIAKIEASN